MAGFFDTLFGGGAEREAADANRKLLQQYQGQGQGYLQTGYDTGVGNLTSALGSFAPLSALGQKYGGGTDLLLGALGAGGPAGTARAQAAFTNAPGYQGAITAGLDAINRRRGVGSMSASGNADIDALTFGQNLQNQQYGDWLNRLGGFVSPELSATSGAAAGQAGAYGSLANLAQQYGQSQVGLAGGVTSGLEQANIGEAAGQASGAKNLLGAGLSLATLGLGGGAGLGSSLFGKLGTGLGFMSGLRSPSGY